MFFHPSPEKREGTLINRACCSAQALCVVFTMLLAACGGGGGGSSGLDLSTAPGLSVSPASVAFAALQNGAIPPAQNIQITLSRSDIAFVVVSYLATPTLPTWLTQSPSLTCSGPNCTLTGGPITTSIATGTYTTTIRIAIQDAGHNVLAFRDVPVSYAVTSAPVTASPSALNFSSVVGGAAPAAQTVALMGDVGAWSASPNQTWIGAAPSSGSGIGNVSVSVNPAGLVPNTYNGSVTFNTAGGTVPVNVTLTVSAPAIQPSPNSLTFSGVNGATLASQSLTIGMNNGAALNWTASAADSWLVLNRTSGTQADPLVVSVNPANGPLASGPYSSTITLTGTSGGSSLNKTINVALTLTKATLSVTPGGVALGGSNGRDFSGVPVQLSLNTGANAFLWNSTASSFVQRSLSSGNMSATPLTVTLTPLANGLVGGTYNGSVNFTVQVNGDTVSNNLPVTFNLESHKLLVDGNGVALASTPGLSKLTRTLKVRDNLGLATSWAATTVPSWLTVTASGTAGEDLVLTANPTGLATDNLYLATVTITSPDTTVENTETIRVGLWVGLTTPTPTTTISTAYNEVAADPIRPYAYVAGAGGNIQVYNVYTGLPGTPIISGASQVGALAISHDGSTLYAVDTSTLKIVPVNLDTYVAGPAWSLSGAPTYPRIVYARTNGFAFVLAGNGRAYDATSGAMLAPTFFGAVSELAVARNGATFCAETACRTLDYTALGGGQLSIGALRFLNPTDSPANSKDVAISNDAARIYLASGYPYYFLVFDGTTLNQLSTLPGDAYPNIVEVAADGRVFGGAFFGSFTNDNDVWVYDAGGAPLTTRQIAGLLLDRQLKISGDGIRMITLSDAPALTFTTVGP